jgi:precorrin-4/cobalt-precorrin-4 C11-methyltransferase
MMAVDNSNMVYFIGAGPGGPRFLTLEGLQALEKCHLVYALPPYPETFSTYLEGKQIKNPFELIFSEINQEVESALKKGSVGFLIPGDLTVFSPFLPLVEHFGDRSQVIAGVGILNAAAALIKRTLDMPDVSHSVVLTSPKHIDKYGDGLSLAELSSAAGTMVLYMVNRPLADVMDELRPGFGPDTPVVVVYSIGLVEERIYQGTLSNIAQVVGEEDIFGLESGKPSMGIVLIGEVLEAHADPSFWNRRKEKFWDRKN